MKTRIYKGQIPDQSEGWQFLSATKCDGITWEVYEKSQAHSDHWKTYKVIAPDGAPHKAAYWVARNSSTGQIGFARDIAIMRDKRPDLHAKVEAILAKQTKL